MFTVINMLFQSWSIATSGLSFLEQLAYIVILCLVLMGLARLCPKDNKLCQQ